MGRRVFAWLGWSLALASVGCGDDIPSQGIDGSGTGLPTTTATTGAGTTTGADGDTSAADSSGSGTGSPPPEDCVAEPPPEALLRMGTNPDGTLLVAGGRRITPAGSTTQVAGFPADVAVHPTLDVAYITSTARVERKIVTVDLAQQTVIQDLDRDNAFYGLEVAPDGSRVYAAGGNSNVVDYYDTAADGTLTLAGSVSIPSYPVGLALDDTGATLWVGQWHGSGNGDNKASLVYEIDTATMTSTRTIEVPLFAWDIVWVPTRDELYVSTLDGVGIAVVDLVSGTTATKIDVPVSSAGMATRSDGSRVWAAIAGADEVVAIDTATREVAVTATVGELHDDADEALHGSNINALAYAEADDTLYVARGTDNAVSVLSGDTLEVQGAIPTNWYPTDVELTPSGDRLLVSEGKGAWIGPNDGIGITSKMAGTMSTVDLAALDLPAATTQVADNFIRPDAAYPFSCDLPDFPIPSAPGQVSPIEHVILLIKENKTFDCVFGDLDDGDVDTDATLVEWGEHYTPNIHELAREFGISDNFYTESEVSDQGHLWLTSGHVAEYAERTWIESYMDGNDMTGYQLTEAAGPGRYFVHLLDHDVDFTVYGEIVGALEESALGNGAVSEHIDPAFPGGTILNFGVKDEDKANHIADVIAAGDLAPFSYLLLPNDHTQGTSPDYPTPESMVADNDYAVGIVIDALSHSPLWDTTAVFIVQDDPQGCQDHIDVHRSFTVVVSPWARRGHLSHVNASFASVFATIDRILGIPPVGREDAAAAPLWDFFTAVPDYTPYTAIPRMVPEQMNSPGAPGASASARMDFGGPDRNPELEPVLLAYMAWRRGEISYAEAEARIAEPYARANPRRWAELVAESKEEREEYDEAVQAYDAWLLAGTRPPADLDDDDDD